MHSKGFFFFFCENKYIIKQNVIDFMENIQLLVLTKSIYE